MNTKLKIRSHIIDYIKLKMPEFKQDKRGRVKMLICPVCQKIPLSASLFPLINYKIYCTHCSKDYHLEDIVRHFVPEAKDWDENKILEHVRDELKLEITTDNERDKLLNFYSENKWSLVPVANNKKMPIESAWTNKTHYNKEEWEGWLESKCNLGVRTGQVSNLIVIDVDQENLPEEMKNLMGDTLTQKTTRGMHYFYKYEASLPKASITELKVDVETDGGQVIVEPSVVDKNSRKFNTLKIPITMPEELKTFLLERLKNYKSTETKEEEIKKAIEDEDLKIDSKDFELVNNNLEGCCNNSFIKLGGILRKGLNTTQTEFALRIFNKHLLENPMEDKAIRAMCRELEKYSFFDETELADDIIHYLKLKDAPTSDAEIEVAVLGERAKGENKKRIAKTLQYLRKEDKIAKVGRLYQLVKAMDWSDELVDVGKSLDFKVPYFENYCYFYRSDLIILGSQNKYGKCFAKGTKILMADGSAKAVENIIENDKIQGANNQIRTVLNTCTGYDTMYEINPTNNSSFVVNSEHILCLYHIVKKEYQNITVKDYLQKSKYYKRMTMLYTNKVDWETKKVPLDPYFVGLWLGDGHNKTQIGLYETLLSLLIAFPNSARQFLFLLRRERMVATDLFQVLD